MAPLLAHLHESGQALTNDISCIEQKSSTEIKTALDFILKFWIHFVTTDFTWLKLIFFFSSKHHCTCFGFTVHSLTEMIKLRRRCARQPPPSILLSSPPVRRPIPTHLEIETLSYGEKKIVELHFLSLFMSHWKPILCVDIYEVWAYIKLCTIKELGCMLWFECVA